ncbi:MAG: sulfotransferase family 2 domain-containing protein [Gammaproteobacteria bacterium]|nr:sulfotransferase family 2 domain-containing protein [Gammaproteobacteria bacterium]MBU1777817.1 sulfotransferase family 2 domain-containing protein [Gammaproteobacteria bacterium]
MRNVIVHYHIFKNAGSTIDHILQNNFKNSWIAYDGEKAHSRISPQELENFIVSHPSAQAVSSHNAIIPVPVIPGIAIAPILFLRHPLDRIRSIYDFERFQGQRTGPVSRGAEHAARLNFDEYIQWRFDSSRNGVTHNHHTTWLLHHPRFQRVEISQADFEQALHTLDSLPFFGLVERFDESLGLLSAFLGSMGIHINMEYQVKNSSKHQVKPLEERLSILQDSIGSTTWSALEARNQWDLKLYATAQKKFQARLDEVSKPAYQHRVVA